MPDHDQERDVPEMVRKVARALARDAGEQLAPEKVPLWQFVGAQSLNNFVNGRWPRYVVQARAAIYAMREPTRRMIADGEVACFEWMAGSEQWQRDAFKDGFQAAIDAALSPDGITG